MSSAGFQFDTRETADEVRAGMLYLAQLRERMNPIIARMDAGSVPEPATESLVAIIDSFNAYEPLSHQIASLLSVSVDNIRSTLSHVETTSELPMTALYSMIRSAIEATSYGLWILRAGTQDKKAFYSLRLSYQNNEDLRGLEKVLGVSRSDITGPKGNIRDRIRERQKKIRSYAGHNIESRPKITSIIMEADKSVTHRSFVTGLQAWKVCSGIAHANMAVIRAVLERVPTGEVNQSGMTFQLTSRVTFIAAFLAVAVENLECLVAEYERACMPGNQRKSIRDL